MMRTTPKDAKQALETMLDAFQVADDTGREIIRHAIQHLTWPVWLREWPSAVLEDKGVR